MLKNLNAIIGIKSIKYKYNYEIEEKIDHQHRCIQKTWNYCGTPMSCCNSLLFKIKFHLNIDKNIAMK